MAAFTSQRQLGAARELAQCAGRWRKMKGLALVRLKTSRVRRAEIHWYEAHGIGKKGMKIKRLLD